MELSKQKQMEAKKLNATVQYLVFADLLSIGYSEDDAYAIAYPENTALSAQQNNSIKKTSSKASSSRNCSTIDAHV